MNGWRPLTNISDLVLWDLRGYNTWADHAANVALDQGSDWKVVDLKAMQDGLACNANFRVCVDGALRGGAKASGGMTVIAYYPGGKKQLIQRSGTIFGELSSAFLAEALALEWCLTEFTILCDRATLEQTAAGSYEN